MDTSAITALAFVNNAVSARLTFEALRKDGIDLKNVALITLRELPVRWGFECGLFVRYGNKPANDLYGQWRFLSFYVRSASLIRRLRASKQLKRVYVVNNDNLLTSALFVWASKADGYVPKLTVIAEGIMNYQSIELGNRARWRWAAKPLLARTLGLPYRLPQGHLSGAFDSCVERVISFTEHGLKAPQQKVVILPFPTVSAAVAPDPKACLIVHTGLWQWMPQAEYQAFAQAFVRWLQGQGFVRIFAKPHPHVSVGILEGLLPPHEVIADSRSVEEMAAEIPAATVVGTCCTALATLKLIRPDLDCVDFGADYYCRYAYGGDVGVQELLAGTKVRLKNFEQG